MTLHAFNSDIQFVNPLVLNAGDAVVIGVNGFVYGQDTLFLGQTGNDILVAGGVASWLTAFSFGISGQVQGAAIQLADNGLIQAYQALFYNGVNLVFHNAGTIMTDTVALSLRGSAELGSASRIDNSGSIVSGGIAAIYGRAGQTEPYSIHNTGVIASTSIYAVLFDDTDVVNDRLINAGQIVGTVAMGGGSDLYDARGGGTVDGTIGGGLGDDRFRPGAAEEVFSGDAGIDTLDFRGGGGAVVIALDSGWEAGGWAEGDIWTGIENVTGTRGADRIGGDGQNNRLFGAAGNDTIFGAAGGDVLEGGDGNDVFSGGAGNDIFVYRRLGEIGDLISDFSSAAAGNDDRFLISAAGFGGGLSAGTLATTRFRTRADNLAQDGDDRFIFRTTDRTLWFDADGTGSTAAVMVADLQANATVTAGDIVIF
ncbi:hypothetical protein SAMN04488103_10572 [Gemmobacter aquatilis]|uniref:Hemolysin-type calcium-binding repeat-containing protein n=1 Tax=Gemmobacter aquatilis TaxID=933059 RepID=A0A1H8GIY9_9RHOB|nr:calcium-binding protein [Gemmobacter aquatilis]SEN43704.1 hypothetical protein SAMN04488103_10572 [Gemmobacter aquatilis]